MWSSVHLYDNITQGFTTVQLYFEIHTSISHPILHFHISLQKEICCKRKPNFDMKKSLGIENHETHVHTLVWNVCLTSMCSVQRFPGGHSLHLAFWSFFYPHTIPPPAYILPLINQCYSCLIRLWGLHLPLMN